MFFDDILSSLVFNFVITTGKGMVVYIESISSFLPLKSIFFGLLMYTAIPINLFWILWGIEYSHLFMPVVYISMLNHIVIATCIAVQWLLSIEIVFRAGDVACKFIKFIQTTSVILCSGFIIFILILYRYDSFRSKINDFTLVIWVIGPLLSSPQVRFK